ncbi:hypothetical protein ACP4OV_009095 [Aristida adscensionis]
MELVVGASTGAVKALANKLGSLLAQEHTLIRDVRDDIQYINDEVASMQAFLSRLRRGEKPDEQRQDWMKQVREVAYDIEDCVDHAGHRLGDEPRGSGTWASVRKRWYFLTTLHARRCIATEIGNLKARAQQVSERRIRYGVANPESSGSSSPAGGGAPRDRPAPTPQLIGTKEPVGMEEKAVKKLNSWYSDNTANDNAEHPLRLLAIVGVGGVGKTTLAMALYRRFGDKFDCRAHVLASQKFQLLTVLRGLVKQLHEQQVGASNDDLDGLEEWRQDKLKQRLATQLESKRYHILIDDIWSVSAWENIRDSLPSKEIGSIVVTTRFKSVAAACSRQNGQLYEHKPLDKKNSCKLFCRQIISSAGYDCNPWSISSEIIMKTCGGLPLAIILVAGLVGSKLRLDTDPRLYHHLDQVGKDLPELEKNISTEGVTHIVNHCYSQLPADLKTCLLYLTMFPKGCLISRKRLIRRWIAEGFIIEKQGKTVEEVAEECFHELIRWNLIRPVGNSSNGKVKSCQIHDMVFEYIVFKSSDENFITVIGGHWLTPPPTYKVRRLSVHKCGQPEKEAVQKMKLSHVRSLTAWGSFRPLHSTLDEFQILQVLDLEGCKDMSLSQMKKICNMHQLKYLSMRQTDIKKIPKTIDRLEYLEVLDIRETSIKKLPSSVENLQRMIHLLAGNKKQRTALRLTEAITKMRALQTLSGVEIYGRSPATATGRSTSVQTAGPQVLSTDAEPTTICIMDVNGYCCPQKFRRNFKTNMTSASVAKGPRPLAYLENLINLKKLTVYRLRRFTSDDNLLLLSAIEHLSSCNLKFLSIDDDFTGFLDTLHDSPAPPEHLHVLGLSGKLCTLPRWICHLHNLEKLNLSLTSLTTETLSVLSQLPELFSLSFSLHASKNKPSVLKILHKNTLQSGGRVIVPKGFQKIKLLCFLAPVLPPLSFAEGAMPSLQKLELRSLMMESVFGLENLKSLQLVQLAVSRQAHADAKEKVNRIKELLARISPKGGPTVILDEYNEL